MNKHNYLILIDDVLKVVVSEKERPASNCETNEDLAIYSDEYEEWLNSANKFDIADKLSEELFDEMATEAWFDNKNELKKTWTYTNGLEKGILLNAENVGIKEVKTNQKEIDTQRNLHQSSYPMLPIKPIYKPLAYFVSLVYIVETQDELFNAINEVIYDNPNVKFEPHLLEKLKLKFTITRKKPKKLKKFGTLDD